MSRWTEEQLQAINKDGENIIVSAGAGSGKTAVLTERVMRKIEEGININQLLLLTFTHAAAEEMKDRIRKKLLKANKQDQLDYLNSSFITTFDSYALFIVKKYSYILNIPSNVSIVENSIISIKKKELLDQILEEYYSKNDTQFNNLISCFCTKDDDIIRNGIMEIYEKVVMKYGYREYLEDYIDNYFNDKYINIRIEEYLFLLKEKIEDIKNIVKLISDIENIDYVNKLYKVIDPLLKSNSYDEIKLYSTLKLPPLKKESEAYIYKEQLNIKIKELNSLCIYDKEDNIKKSLYSTKENTKIICDILLKFDSELLKVKKINNMYEFNDIAHFAIKLVSENEEIRNNIKKSFNEIMLDEYQDTNDLQETFINLISDNNVYCVGDIKQSIYRFRNANPLLFKNKYDNYKNKINGTKIDLNKNFRSRLEPLDDINLIFSNIMKDDIGGANYKLEHKMIFGNNTYINEGKTNQDYNLDIYEYEQNEFTKEEIEAFVIANDIKNKVENKYQIFDKDEQILRDATYNDFVILMDRKKDFDLYKKVFEYLNIPLTLNKEENISSGYDLDVIKNILKLIIKIKKNEFDNNFKHSFISIERSFLIEETDQNIFNIIKENKYKETPLFKELYSIDINNLNIKELIEIIIDKFDIYNRLIKIGNVEESLIRIEYILNLASSLQNIYSISEFVDYLDKVEQNKLDIKYSVNMKNDQSVKIMTIFKSKGLEFNICYFPGLYNEFNKQEFKEKFFYSSLYGIIIPYKDKEIKETFYKILFKENYNKEEISEKIRLLYVALTRAKEKIILLKPKKDNIKSDIMDSKSFLDMINLVEDLDTRTKNIDIDKLNITKNYNLTKLVDYEKMIDKSNIIINENTKEYRKEELESKKYSKNIELIDKDIKAKLDFGIKIHSILENTDLKNPNISNIKDEYIKNKLTNFISLPLFKNVKNIYQEYEFYYENETINHGIIDLLLEYDNEYIIIDYKLKNIENEAYKNQLNGYKKYIQDMTGKTVKVYLYSFIDSNLVSIS